MDPFTLILGAVSVGMTAYGAYENTQNAKETAAAMNPLNARASQIAQEQAGHEQNINALHQQYMELQNRRAQVENMRNAQVARSHALAAGVNQGAGSGSGVAGGIAQVTDEERYNSLGLNQGLSIGRDIFSQNAAISGGRLELAGLQGQMNQIESQSKVRGAEAAGWSSIGASLGNATGTIGRFTQGYSPSTLQGPRVGPFA